MSNQSVTFTSGSINELWKISVPLMFSWLSVVFMAFVDRLYLAHYSQEALNSTVTSCTLALAFTFGFQSLCEMGSIFVAQYNGAQKHDQIGKIIWQLIWVSLFASLFFIPFAFYGSRFFFASSSLGALESQYFSILVLFGPFNGIIGAVSGFFIGRGYTKIITMVTFSANIMNAVLDPLLIFGYGDIVPSLGIQGAAISSGMSCVFQALILWVVFMRRNNRSLGNLNWQLDWSTLVECVKIGTPTGLFVLLEFAGWGAFYSMMREASSTHILVAGICQSILILFVFFGLGIQKGISSIAGNLIGAQKIDELGKLLKSGHYLIFGYFLFICIPMVLFPDYIISWFLHHPDQLEGVDALENMESVRGLLRTGLLFTCLYLFFDDLRLTVSGILSGAGDTLFLMISGVVGVWVFLLLPAYIGIVKYEVGVEASMVIWVLYSFCAWLIPIYRFYFGKWKDRRVIDSVPAIH